MLVACPTKINEHLLALVREGVAALLDAASDSWSELDFVGLLNMEQARLGYPYKIFMTVLRHALCGRKVGTPSSSFFIKASDVCDMQDGPAIADVMSVIGRDRTLVRLRASEMR